MECRALNKLLDHTEERIRIWDLHKLYSWLLKHNGQVVKVKEIKPNEYMITISVKKHEKKNLGSKVADVSWYDTQYIVLKPSLKSV